MLSVRGRWPQREELPVLAGLALVTGLAWAYTAYLALRMRTPAMEMAMPQAAPWHGVELLLLLLMWLAMMVAMMVPSALPMIRTYAASGGRQQSRRTALFVLGYLVVWGGFSALAALLQWGLHAVALLSPALRMSSPFLGGALLVAAGLYQWSPLKHACLTQCRTPLGFLMSHWRGGPRGALVMGLQHGAYCLGCCWLVMALLFVSGVMNLLWVAILALFVLAEKVAPAGEWLSRAAGLAFLAWGAWIIAGGLG